MNDTLIIISKVLPIILLIVLGNLLKKIEFFKQNTIDDLKKFIVNISLPALLFIAFTGTKFESKYLLICVAVFFTCIFMLFSGIFLKKLFKSDNRYFPAVFASFETGMIGYSIFVTVFGSENTYKLAVIDLGNIIFIFLILVSYLQKLNGKSATIQQLLMSFFKSPVILAVLLGSLLSSTGAIEVVKNFPISNSFLDMIKLLSNLTVPVICMVIGYELHLDFKNLGKPLITAILRISILMIMAFLINTFLMEKVLHLDKIFKIALYTMFLLPPTFLLPIFIEDKGGEEKQFILNTISVHIILSLITFLVMIVIV